MDVNFDALLLVMAHTNTSDDGQDDNNVEIQQQQSVRSNIHIEYRGIITHAMDRIDLMGGGDNSSSSSMDVVIPIIEALSKFVAESTSSTVTVHDDDASTSRVVKPGLKFGLCILRLCLVKLCRDNNMQNNVMEEERFKTAVLGMLRAGVVALEYFHLLCSGGDISTDTTTQQIISQPTTSNNPNDDEDQQQLLWKEPHIVAAWLVLDLIALLLDMRSISIDYQHHRHQPTGRTDQDKNALLQQQQYQTIISEMAPLVSNGGMYYLLLDLFLYTPGGGGGNMQYNNIISGGMSTQGIARMQEPFVTDMSCPPTISQWNELKLAMLRIAVGGSNDKGGGIFCRNRDTDDEDDEKMMGDDGNDSNEVERSDHISVDPSRAITLLVLATAGRGLSREKNAMELTRYAGSSLEAYLNDGGSASQRPSTIYLQSTKKKAKKKKKDPAQHAADCKKMATVIHASSMLLFLALGETETRAVLQKHREESTLSDVCNLLDSIATDQRSPLPSRMVSIVLNFVTEQLQSGNDEDSVPLIEPRSVDVLGEDVTILVKLAFHAAHLALQLNEPNDNARMRQKLQIGWGDGVEGVPARAAALMQALSKWLNACQAATKVSPLSLPNVWLDNTRRQIFDAALTFLRVEVLANIGGDAATPRQQRDNNPMADHLGNDGGIWEEDRDRNNHPMAEHHGGDAAIWEARDRMMEEAINNAQNRRARGILMRQERIQMARNEKLVPPLSIRRACVEIIRDTAKTATNVVNNSDDKNSLFEVPILLFNCLAVDKELSLNIAIALESLLEVYKELVRTYCVSMEGWNGSKDLRMQAAAPLLPSLLTSSTAESATSRRLAALWATDIIQCLDPEAASALCTFLVGDIDQITSKAARRCISTNKGVGANTKNEVGSCVLFFDSSNELDMEIMNARLQQGASSFDLDDKRCNIDDNMEVDNVQCNICFDDEISNRDMYSLKQCGQHKFCKDCFVGYLEVKLDEHDAAVECAQQGCTARVVEADVKELLRPEQLVVWKKQQLEADITKSSNCRTCPGIDCSMVAYSETPTDCTAACNKCQTSFCFRCGEEPHAPAKCSDVEDFLPLLNSSEYMIKKHAKRCPGPNCNVPIEKNEGCNHMTCTNCKTHFCWICLSEIGGYADLDRHVCNKYDPKKDDFDPSERNEFYLLRFEACDDSEAFAKRQLDSLAKQFQSEEAIYDINPEDFGVLSKAGECLVYGQHFLKYTYCVAWAWDDNDERKKLFENHQAVAATFAEKLASLTETKLENLHGERGFDIHLRALEFHTFALKMYAERMTEFLDL